MRTIETTVYTFDELSEEAKQKALEELSDINTDFEWWDAEYEDFKECAAILGIDIKNIYFSGFSSQGDGAQFVGAYGYSKGASKEIRSHAPLDEELHEIADRLQDLQKPYFYKLTATVKSRGHYSHANCTDINVYDDYSNLEYRAETPNVVPDLKDALRDFMRWMYRRLEKQYWYLVSEEAIKETIEANEYEFTEDGKLA